MLFLSMFAVAKQPQLSVIVVPVTCSVIAVVIIVFGVAYYVQSKMRYVNHAVLSCDRNKLGQLETIIMQYNCG